MKNANTKRRTRFFAAWAAVTVLAASLLLTACPHKPKDTPKPQTVTITVEGDENVTVKEPKTFEVAKGSKWSSVKTEAVKKLSYKDGYEAKGFKLGNKDGEDLKDDYAFNGNKTVFALSKIKGITYTVEHRLQNAEDNGYTLKETEEKPGKAGEDTAAAAKTYKGFTAKAITQQKIKADSSTVVKIEYDRNIITLKLNLNGGSSDTPLENGEGGTKLLTGKYGAKVKLENLGKTGNVLEKWTPPLPETFPVSSPAETYTASWVDGYIVTIKGDERTEITDNTFKATLSPIQTWNAIAAQVKAKVNLKPEWQGGDYEVYEWRLGGEAGTKLGGEEPINKHFTVYAVTNYAKFNIEGTKIKGYKGNRPKGKIIIPDSTTEIEKQAFSYCEGLTDVDFSGCTNLTQIGYSTFENCKNLTDVDFSGCTNLTQIGYSTFDGCTNLTNADFSNCTKLTQIGLRTFARCKSLTSIKLPANLTTIAQKAFECCDKLTDINLPTKLTEIGYSAFGSCTQLEGADFSACKELTKIYEKAFSECPKLKTVNLPESLTEIDGNPFYGCENLTNLTVDPANKKYKAEGNVVYTKDGKTLVLAASGLTEVNILGTVTTIGKGAFSGCKLLKSINLPADLTEIKIEAFYGCTGLKGTIVFPAKLKTMEMTYDNDDGVFQSCTQLEGADFSACKELTKIRKKAFSGCTKLKTVNLPESLTQIDNNAFRECTALQSAVFADKTGWAVYNNWSFKDIHNTIDEDKLKNPAMAAKYLREKTDKGGYSDKFWKKK
ncbi:leucine-rich repeat domain-containing protein [Treponema sp. OMZ 788]|uniref:leucine-rich repeat domain-containing protein n=1 Tax=Treponema sp. OMZ 788 TaxID=2563664 RepID=UPI0020A5D080|nr:leucine-rich repeat domain-containing protein [Treponema sp. OMZ 788]UTC64040.1 leucine-rich repeat domain-containing protein [Treponema sp. OMZ 788]